MPGKSKRRRYHAKARKQKLRYNGVLIGCTDTAFAMAIDGASEGAVMVTEAQVRALSNEAKPDPASPGLNLDQLVQVAKRLHVEFTNRSGDSWSTMLDELAQNARVVAQLWYPVLGGGSIGHAVYVERVKDGKARIVDPVKGTYEWVDAGTLRRAMREFADRSQQVVGLRWGVTRRAPWISDDQSPQQETDQ